MDAWQTSLSPPSPVAPAPVAWSLLGRASAALSGNSVLGLSSHSGPLRVKGRFRFWCYVLWPRDPRGLQGSWGGSPDSSGLVPAPLGSIPGFGCGRWAGAGVGGLSWAPGAGGFMVLHGPATGCCVRLGWMSLHRRVRSPLIPCDGWLARATASVSGWSVPGAGPAPCPARGCGLQGRLLPNCPVLGSPSPPSPTQPRCKATAQFCFLESPPAPHTWPVQNPSPVSRPLGIMCLASPPHAPGEEIADTRV